MFPRQRRGIGWITIGLLFAIGVTVRLSAEDAAPLPAALHEVLALTNAARAKAKLAPLVVNQQLMQAARQHSETMARLRRAGHSIDGTSPQQRIEQAGYRCRTWAENVAAGQPTANTVVAAWLRSRGHRANILDPNCTEIGLGVAQSADGIVFWTQVFASPRPDSAPKDDSRALRDGELRVETSQPADEEIAMAEINLRLPRQLRGFK